MPAYTQIEAYARCDREGLPNFLARCGAVLRDLGTDEARVSEWLATVQWDDQEGGVSAGNHAGWFEVIIDGVSYNVWPIIPGWPNDVYPEAAPGWLSLELNFATEDVEAPGFSGQYRNELGPGLWHMMCVTARYFPDRGVFLTDEVQEGKPFEGIAEGDSAKVFAFDLGIMPIGLVQGCGGIPISFAAVELGADAWGFANKSRWTELPWIADEAQSLNFRTPE